MHSDVQMWLGLLAESGCWEEVHQVRLSAPLEKLLFGKAMKMRHLNVKCARHQQRLLPFASISNCQQQPPARVLMADV